MTPVIRYVTAAPFSRGTTDNEALHTCWQQIELIIDIQNKVRHYAALSETFPGHLFLLTFKEGEKCNRRNVLNISRIPF